MTSIQNKIFHRVARFGRGSIVTSKQFLDLGSRSAVDVALFRLARLGSVRRLAPGLYDYPRQHPRLGLVGPDADKVAQAIAARDGIKMQHSGAYAANVLGLSTQVPAKIVYLTDGPSRVLKMGKQTVQFKHTTPKNMATAGRVSGLVIHALRFIGKHNVDACVINTLQQRLTPTDKKQLLRDIRYAPTWIGKCFRMIHSA